MAKALEKNKTEGRLDLTISRVIAAPCALIWQAWTKPKHLKEWWAPLPWTTPECAIDLRPGGRFYTLMRGPDGDEHGGEGCFLEVVEPERIVFTDALEGGWRPASTASCGGILFTAIVTFEEHAGGTLYTVRALHKDDADREAHEKMGFHEGWGTCADQLAKLAERLKAGG